MTIDNTIPSSVHLANNSLSLGDWGKLAQTSKEFKSIATEKFAHLFDQIAPSLNRYSWYVVPAGATSDVKMRALLNLLHDLGIFTSELSPTKKALLAAVDEHEAPSLIAMYSRIEIPNKPTLSGTVHEQAILIRTWMQDHAEELSHVQHLDLSGMNLSTIPQELDIYFTGLEILNLEGNQITAVPNFAHLPRLEAINLEKNQLIILPNFTHLPLLRIALFRNNLLSTIPNFTHLSNLIGLFLEDNQLSTIPDLSSLPNLLMVSLEKNQLISVPINLWRKLAPDSIPQTLPWKTTLMETGYHLFRLNNPSSAYDILITMHEVNVTWSKDIRRLVIEAYNHGRHPTTQLPIEWDGAPLDKMCPINVEDLYDAFRQIAETLEAP